MDSSWKLFRQSIPLIGIWGCRAPFRAVPLIALAATFATIVMVHETLARPTDVTHSAWQLLDCHGGAAVVSGDRRRIRIANCSDIKIVASFSEVTAQLPRRAKVLITGNDNVVRLDPKDGISYSEVKDAGQRNSVAEP